jgi:ADP-heptose:LPS heptosyltransferase
MKLRTKEYIDAFAGNLLIALNVIPVRVAGFLLRRDHSLRTPPSCIIITKLLGLGSLLMATDAILAIKKKYPKARLVLVCSNTMRNEALHLALFDEVWGLNDSSFSGMALSFSGILLKSWRIRNKWVVNIEVYSKLSTIFSLWTFAQNRFGFYFNEVRFRQSLNTHHVYFNQSALAYDNYKQIANAMHATVDEIYRLPVRDDKSVGYAKKFIAINNNCSELAKERLIPIDTLLDVIRQLLQDPSIQITLIGSRQDHAYNESIVNNPALKPFEGRIDNIAGIYSFIDFVTILKNNCLLMLTIDSGPVHFAYRLQLPTVSVWGPTRPDTRIPPDFPHPTIYLHAPCSPCVHQTNILPCGGDNFCMKNIQAAEIVAAVKNELSR